MLEKGEIDAMISAHMPSPFVRRSRKVQRLIPNFREVEADYFRRTKIFPIMHTVALREEFYEKHPWVAQSLFKAFAESKRLCQEAMYEFSALKYMMAWSIDEMEKEREILDDHEPLADAIVQFRRYALALGLLRGDQLPRKGMLQSVGPL